MTQLRIAERLGQDAFLAQTLHRDYRHVPGALAMAELGALVSYEVVNDIVARHRLEPPRLRLARHGDTLPPHRYATAVTTRRATVWQRVHPAELHQRLAEGASLVIDQVDHLHQPIGDLAAELESWLRAPVQVNLYASWTATEGFGTHWDDHDVVVVQVEGAKRWRLFGPTRHVPLHRDVADPEPPDETAAELVMRPGDVLYLPRGWWHAVTADQGTPSLHLTCGITPPHTGSRLLNWLADELLASDTFRADLPLHLDEAAQAQFLALLGKQLATALEDPRLLHRYAAAQDAADMGRLRPSLPYVATVPADSHVRVRLTTGRARVTAVTVNGEDLVRITGAGQEVDAASAAAPLLHRLLETGWHELGELADTAGVPLADAAALVAELVAAQMATVRAQEDA
ncbi:JmjC domain-containing protein [Streptomyces sp. MB09-02B]|uniref:JmjC domain-containing protein n=1 Tax=Streptomyces sp. MB09-02B TaxID=3028667 RepID=UPI0029A775B8|nr:cupin domain-containing protein [Streptomyces sp. MB09-02B]MDX3641322.1 cupin domain-containing protein [Streptomyces sp. MB09-02B]